MVNEEILLAIRDDGPRTAGINPPSSPAFISDGESKGGSETPKKNSKRKRAASPETIAQREKKKAERLEKKELLEEEALAKKRRYLIVGVDFGCTYSGVAFISSSNEKSNADVISCWSHGNKMEKVPTRIAYADENPGFPDDITAKCGYDVQSGEKNFQWFKLQLDRNTADTGFDDSLLRCAGLGIGRTSLLRSAAEISSDYFRFLYEQTLTYLETRMHVSVLKETPIKFYVTTPAMWSLEARSETRRAASLAGMGTRVNTMEIHDELHMIDEPEAAAIGAIKPTLEKLPGSNSFEDDQLIIVADLGGGTADLVSYRIVEKEPLKLEEICVGVGGKLGGTSIDRALHVLMNQRFGRAFADLEEVKSGLGSDFMDEFEKHKRNFTIENKGRIWALRLVLKTLDETDQSLHAYYDFQEYKVKLTWYGGLKNTIPKGD